MLALLLSPSRSYPNLFDAHPPFQIDGNFGGAAGILEMLVQSSEDKVLLLPALPPQWPSGEVRGIRARGGLELDLQWSEAGLTKVRVKSAIERSVVVECRGARQEVTLAAGEAVKLVF